MALIQYLVPVHFDIGAISHLKDELDRLEIRTPLIVTDQGLLRSGLFETIAAHLPAGVSGRIFGSTPQNPTESATTRAVAQYRHQACDGIIGIGGGSPIDLAKATALLATHTGPLSRFAAVSGGGRHITSAVAPVIAVPTTSGTGTEVGRATLIVMNDGQKLAIVSQHLLPKAAICDPELTLTLPRLLTAGTGMDAIAHCLETFLSPAENPPADAIALDGLARGAANLEQACANGNDLSARREMMMASLEGGLSFQKGLGAVHAMSHPLGALQEVTVHHGTANALLLPTVLRFNAPVAEAKFARIRRVLGIAANSDLPDFFRRLARGLGLPLTLKAIGIRRNMLPALAEAAALDLSSRTNPRPADRATYQQLYEEAYG